MWFKIKTSKNIAANELLDILNSTPIWKNYIGTEGMENAWQNPLYGGSIIQGIVREGSGVTCKNTLSTTL